MASYRARVGGDPAGDQKGIGYTYADKTTAVFIKEHLFPLFEGEDAVNNTLLWDRMFHHVRNLGRQGIAAMAISAVDTALWDLKARFLRLPLCQLLGQQHKTCRSMPVAVLLLMARKSFQKTF